MFHRARMAWGLVVAAALVAGCATTPPLQPQGKVVIPVQSGDRPQAKVKLLNEVVVQLPPISTPGYAWTVVLNDERFLDELHPIQLSAGGGATASFLAIRAGRRPIRFFALPPNAREGTPAQAYEIFITIE